GPRSWRCSRRSAWLPGAWRWRSTAGSPAARISRGSGCGTTIGSRWSSSSEEARTCMKTDRLTIAGTAYASRLIVGTGKYPTFEVMRRAIEASGASLVTVAVRRVDLARRDGESLLDHLDLETLKLLPNTP